MNQEQCEYCDGVVEPAIIRVPFKYKKEMIYIDHVPVRRCSQCGEIYYEAEVYKRLEMIAENRGAITTHVTFPLADYATADLLGA
ncbi:MAG: YgiT-type zinc finger protein [Blastocatellia bacterium]